MKGGRGVQRAKALCLGARGHSPRLLPLSPPQAANPSKEACQNTTAGNNVGRLTEIERNYSREGLLSETPLRGTGTIGTTNFQEDALPLLGLENPAWTPVWG